VRYLRWLFSSNPEALQEGLDQFRPRRLREQVVADGPVRPIDQAVAEDGMQGVELLVAIVCGAK
jgi:hypothetical protein